MKTVLVTGSEGSLAQAIIPYLIKDYNVLGVDIKKSIGKYNYEFTRLDLTQSDQLWKIYPVPDYIIHCAANIYGVVGFHKNPATILGHDTTMTANLLDFSVENSVRKFIFISSSMVYESYKLSLPVTEDVVDLVNPDGFMVPSTDYGLSKYMGERLCHAYWKQYTLPYTIWRPFNIITPFERVENEEQGERHVFADFFEEIIFKGKTEIPILGNGEQIRCFSWIDDVAKAITSYSFEKNTPEIFNVGNPEPISMKELAQMISKMHTGKELTFIHKPIYRDDVQFRVPDVSRLAKEYGYICPTVLKESIQNCLNVFKNSLTTE